jgi:hypothetical protein
MLEILFRFIRLFSNALKPDPRMNNWNPKILWLALLNGVMICPHSWPFSLGEGSQNSESFRPLGKGEGEALY